MTFPTIPDNFYKLLILCGLSLLIYSYISNQKSNDKFYDKTNTIFHLSDSIEANSIIMEFEGTKLINYSNYVKEIEGVEKLFFKMDSVIYFNNEALKKIKSQVLKDSAEKMYANYNNNYFYKVDLLLKLLKKSKENIKEDFSDLKVEIHKYNAFLFISYILLFFGLIGFIKHQLYNDKLLKHQLAEKHIYLWCQSCGKSFSSTRQRGKNVDNSTNEAFCFQCFDRGHFTDPNLTFDDIITKTKNNLAFKNLHFIKRFLILKRIRKIDRWNTDKY